MINSNIAFLDENLSVKAIDERYAVITYFFNSVAYRNPLGNLFKLLKDHGLCFEGERCEVYDDPTEYPDEDPFEVRFRVPHLRGEPFSTVYVTWEQFFDLLRLFAKSHLHKHPEDEAELRQMFEENGVAFEIKE